jgi:hypothetical protein
MQCALPFMLPLEKCVSKEVQLGDKKYNLQFHNHLDRQFIIDPRFGGFPKIRLVPKKVPNQPEAPLPVGQSGSRQQLQSIAIVTEMEEFLTPEQAFKQAEKKIETSIQIISDFLAALQRQLPYLATWTVYPISLFDVGLVHHGIDHFCPNCQAWGNIGTGMAISVARQLQAPQFTHVEEDASATAPELGLADELLAEAKVSIFRGLLRLAVLNSFSAVEIVSNSTYKKMYTDRLKSIGLPDNEAISIAENFQKQYRNDEGFLIGRGLKTACNMSLVDDNKKLYDEFLNLEKTVRHQVSHAGKRPAATEASRCHEVCCEVVRYLWQARGITPRPMLPQTDLKKLGFQIGGSGESHLCSAQELEHLRLLMGMSQRGSSATPPDAGCAECNFGTDKAGQV